MKVDQRTVDFGSSFNRFLFIILSIISLLISMKKAKTLFLGFFLFPFRFTNTELNVFLLILAFFFAVFFFIAFFPPLHI